MTVASTPLPRVQWNASGQTTFTFDFEIDADTDLYVAIDDVQKTLQADYTVSGVRVETGGSVTFLSAPANGAKVTILRAEPLRRAADQQESIGYRASSFNAEFDRLTRLLQQLNERLSRTLRLKRATTADVNQLSLPEPAPDKFLRWNALGNTIVNADVASVLGEPMAIPVTVPNGGTGASTAAGARTNLGLGTAATKNIPSLTGNTLKYARVTADETAFEFRTPAQTATDIGAMTQGWHTVFVPVSAMMDEPTYKPSNLTVDYNSTYGAYFPYRQFSGSAINQLGVPLIVPRSAVGGQIRARFWGWCPSNNSGNMLFALAVYGFSAGKDITATSGINSSVGTVTSTPGNANILFVSDWTSAVTLIGHVDGTYLGARIYRHGDHANDTSSVAFRLAGVEIQYQTLVGNDA